MIEYIILLSLGICVVILGAFTSKRNIFLIHWYNRMKVTPGNEKAYGKVVGIGMIVMGASISATSILQMIFDIEVLWSIIIIGFVVGLAFILYGQWKYNKGIF